MGADRRRPVCSGASVTTSQAGAGYGVPPIIFIPPPAPAASNSNGVGGIQASAYAVIANGTVSTVSFVNQGAGYGSGFTIVCQPNPTDPNIATGITLGTVLFSLVGAGSLTGVLMTNPGAPLALPASITLAYRGRWCHGHGSGHLYVHGDFGHCVVSGRRLRPCCWLWSCRLVAIRQLVRSPITRTSTI